LRASVLDGAFFSVMIGAGETYVPAFVLALGMGDVVAGLVATVPMLIGAFLQLASPWAVRQLGSHRRWVVCCATTQALSLAVLPLCVLINGKSIWLVFVATTLYWAAGLATGPAWNTWVESLVPKRLRARFFAARTRVCQVGTLTSFILSGLLLQYYSGYDQFLWAFSVLFSVAATCRFLSAWCLSRHRESNGEPAYAHVGISEVLGRLRGHTGARLLVYLLAVQTGVYISAPYFTPYMLVQLHFSYWQFVTLTATAYFARILFLPLWGKVAHEGGARRLLWIGSVGIMPLAGLWLVSSDFHYLVVLQFFAGMTWSAYELAMMLMFFETIPRSERTSLLTLYNLGNSTAMVAGACLGAVLLRSFGAIPATYGLLFALSTLVRLATLLLLRKIPKVHFHPVQPATRSLTLRPSAGAIENPILPSIPNGDKPRACGGDTAAAA
jgi:MFS family permease